jgi:glycosyltransferase involved in cell wall biosynthesis
MARVWARAQKGELASMTGIRVCIVTPYGGTTGGAEAWLLDVIDSGLGPAEDLDLSAVVLDEGPMIEALSSRGIRVKLIRVGGTPLAMAQRATRVWGAVSSQRPDVILTNGIKAQLVLGMAAARWRTPTIWVKHDHSYDSTLARPLAMAATLIVATADEVGTATHRSDTVVIEPPRPPQPLPVEVARAELVRLGCHLARPLTVAMVARLVPYKGVDVAVRALAFPDADEWELIVMGAPESSAPDEPERLRQIAREWGVADRVHLLGRVPNAGRLLSATDALAVLTHARGRRDPGREGFGVVATEAMLAGVPVVFAGEGPIARRLATPCGPAGISVSSPDPRLVGAALGQLSDAPTRLAMGARGRRAAQTHPDRWDVGRQLADVVRRVAGRA